MPFVRRTLIALSAVTATSLALAADPVEFNTQYDALDKARSAALAEGRKIRAAEISHEIGELFVAHEQNPDNAAANFEQAADLYTELARGTALDASRRTFYQKAHADLARARATTRSAATRARLDQEIAALEDEMKEHGVPIPPAPGTPAPAPPTDEPAPRPSADPTVPVPYTGPSVDVELRMVEHTFAVSVPTLFEPALEVREALETARRPLTPELRKAAGVPIKNVLVGVALNQLDQDPRVTCVSRSARLVHERVTFDGLEGCFISHVRRGHSHLTRGDAVSASYYFYFVHDETHFKLAVTATLESKDPATPKLLGAALAMARSLRLVGAPPDTETCKAGEARLVSTDARTFEYASDDAEMLFAVAKDNDAGVAAAKGMAAFWKAGTVIVDLVVDLLPPAAGKSGLAVGFVIDYLKKGGEIIARLADSPLTGRANEIKAELFVVTTKVQVACETHEVCRDGAWVRERRPVTRETSQGGHRATSRVSKHLGSGWGHVENKKNPDFVDLDRLEVWSKAFLEAQLAVLRARKAEHDVWLALCR